MSPKDLEISVGPDLLDNDDAPESGEEALLIHGLSVARYRAVHTSVLKPAILADLASANSADFVATALELKQSLWAAFNRPRLVETAREDGQVEVQEVFDMA